MRKCERKVFRIGTVRYHWPMSAHASQAFSIASCTDSEDLPCESAKVNMYKMRKWDNAKVVRKCV